MKTFVQWVPGLQFCGNWESQELSKQGFETLQVENPCYAVLNSSKRSHCSPRQLRQVFCFSLKLNAGVVAYSTSTFCVRYFQALTSNMGILKYKEVYAAAAEVLGLALQYIAERENVSELYCAFEHSCLNFMYIFDMTTQFISKK